VIVLTQAQANAVRGITVAGHAIEPVQLDNTPRFILGEEVLSDPKHITKRANLNAAERRELTQDEKDRFNKV
jgi:hypothetical protein